jgi:hypothetical protein
MSSAGFGPTGDEQIRGHRGGKPVVALAKADDGVPMMFTPAGNMQMNLRDGRDSVSTSWREFAVPASC